MSPFFGPPIPGSPWFPFPGPSPGTSGQSPALSPEPVDPAPPGTAPQVKTKPFVERVPDVQDRLRRFTEKVSTIFNSLFGRGHLIQVEQNSYAIIGGGRSAARAPTNTDDLSAGIAVGSVWVNTATNRVYINVVNTVGAAVWRGPF